MSGFKMYTNRRHFDVSEEYFIRWLSLGPPYLINDDVTRVGTQFNDKLARDPSFTD